MRDRSEEPSSDDSDASTDTEFEALFDKVVADILTATLPERVHDSVASGSQRLAETLSSQAGCKDALGLSPAAFTSLLRYLNTHALISDSTHISSAEKVAMFLFYTRHGTGVRGVAGAFQHSYDTVSQCVRLFVCLYTLRSKRECF